MTRINTELTREGQVIGSVQLLFGTKQIGTQI